MENQHSWLLSLQMMVSRIRARVYNERGRQLRRPYLLSRIARTSCAFSHAFSCSRESIVRCKCSTSGGSLAGSLGGAIFSWERSDMGHYGTLGAGAMANSAHFGGWP